MNKNERYVWATEAHHALGDISREDGDVAFVTDEYESEYVGQWLTGFGFINVRFPKAGTRPLSWMERAYLDKHPVVLA